MRLRALRPIAARPSAPSAAALRKASASASTDPGAGSYAMDYSHDEQTPPNVQADIVAQFKPREEED